MNVAVNDIYVISEWIFGWLE